MKKINEKIEIAAAAPAAEKKKEIDPMLFNQLARQAADRVLNRLAKKLQEDILQAGEEMARED